MLWHSSNISFDEIKRLSAKFKINYLKSEIAIRRGLDDPNSLKFLIENDLSFLHQPFLLPNLEEAIDRILLALSRGEKVEVFGDRDVDGITSTTLLAETLGKLGLAITWVVPEGDDSYGLSEAYVRSLSNKNVGLLVTVDNGISSVSEINHARNQGIDVIVIDHHEPLNCLPQAILVNPKLKASKYPFKQLSACAVVWKVVWGIHFSWVCPQLYKKNLCLLTANPLNDCIEIKAIILRNFVPIDSLLLIVNHNSPYDASLKELLAFVKDKSIYVYDKFLTTDMLKRVLGKIDLKIIDLEPLFSKILPKYEGVSLLKLREKSKRLRYSKSGCTELEILCEIFQYVFLSKYNEFKGTVSANLDLVALSTISDQMPLKDENRIFVKQGLKILSETQRVGLRDLLSKTRLLKQDITPMQVAFRISPILNAAGRMGHAPVALNLLMATDFVKVNQIHKELLSIYASRKKRTDEVWSSIQRNAQNNFFSCDESFVWVSINGLQRGITGMIAAKLLELFRVPALVLADQGKEVVGSIRTQDNLTVEDILTDFMDILSRWGGHSHAGGFSFPSECLGVFKERLSRKNFKKIKTSKIEEKEIKVDATIEKKDLSPEVWLTNDFFAPYGKDNMPVTFLMKQVKIKKVDLVGKKIPRHLKITFDFPWPAMFWNAGDRFDKKLVGKTVNILFRVERTVYNDNKIMQIVITDLNE